MTTTIDHFSINNDFWIQFRSHLVSLGFKGLPENVHYTISFSDASANINFHVTKNAADPKNKPQIKIVEIEKTLLEEIAPHLIRVLLNRVLHPLDVAELKNRLDYIPGYISYDSLAHPDFESITERELKERFKDITRIRKKTRLKIEGDVGQRLNDFAESPEMQMEVLNNILEIPDAGVAPVEGGIIILEGALLQVVRINKKWYELKLDLHPKELLEMFLEPSLAKRISWAAKRALVSVKNAQTYVDVAHLNKPVRLVKKQKDHRETR